MRAASLAVVLLLGACGWSAPAGAAPDVFYTVTVKLAPESAFWGNPSPIVVKCDHPRPFDIRAWVDDAAVLRLDTAVKWSVRFCNG